MQLNLRDDAQGRKFFCKEVQLFSDSIDTFWVLFSAILVLLMQVGFLFLETGLTRTKNAINVALKNLSDLIVVSFIWWIAGFGLMFGTDFISLISNVLEGKSSSWIDSSHFTPNFSFESPSLATFFLFQMLFCATACTIVSGAIAERTRFNAYLIIAAIVAIVVYPVVGNLTWGHLVNDSRSWLNEQGFVDFAGSTVVHSLGGWVALAAMIIIGPRHLRFNHLAKNQKIHPSSPPFALVGSCVLIFGWFGFNAGSTLAFNEQVPIIIINTLFAASSGAITCYLLNKFHPTNAIDATAAPITGILAGLVAITAGCHAVSTGESIIIGSLGAAIGYYCASLLVQLKIDDAIQAVPTHLAAGVWGTLAVALFGDLEILATGLNRAEQVATQILGIFVVGTIAFTTSYLLFSVVNRFYPFRVDLDSEQIGLNISEHNAHTDLIDLMAAMQEQQEKQDFSIRLPVEPFTEAGQIAAQHNRLMDELVATQSVNTAIVSEITAGILTLDDECNIHSFNPAAEKILDIASIAARGKKPEALIRVHSANDLNTGRSFPLIYVPSMFYQKSSFELNCSTLTGKELWLEIQVTNASAGSHSINILLTDISDRRKIEDSLHAEIERSNITLDSIADGVITTDGVGLVTYMNKVAEQLTGWTGSEARGHRLMHIFPIVDGPEERPSDRFIHLVIEEKKSLHDNGSKIMYNRDGEAQAIRVSASPIFNKRGVVDGSVTVFQDVTSDRVLERQLTFQAKHDSLTGLYNRAELERLASEKIAQCKDDLQTHTLCFLDLDQFKIINDTCGHTAGDHLLKQISSLFLKTMRSSDIAARLGGDEFGFIFCNCSLENGVELAESIKSQISSFKFAWDNKHFEVGASMGLTEINSKTVDINEVLQLADAACYKSKESGRNSVHCYQPNDTDLIKKQSQANWVNRINRALEENRFELFLQLIAPTTQNESAKRHFEVLIRKIDEDGRYIPPGAFIPIAERYNLMTRIDQWVIENTFARISSFELHNADDIILSINLSGDSIGRQDFLDFVLEKMSTYQIDPKTLCFEITETAAIANLNEANKLISKLSNIGCQFSLDDFGSGLSSFSYLKNLPVDFLKIDGSFIKEIDHCEVDKSMVESINKIGKTMGLKTIAEFVESEIVLNVLNELEVDYAQGYYMHKPEPFTKTAIQQFDANTNSDAA